MNRINNDRDAEVYDAYMTSGVTQREVGERFGIASNTVCKIVSAERRRRLCSANNRNRTIKETKQMMKEFGIAITFRNLSDCMKMSRARMHIHAGFLRDSKNFRDFGEPVNASPRARYTFRASSV